MAHAMMNLLSLVLYLVCVCGSVAQHTQPETVMIISMDGVGWQFTNANNTPNLERVAKEGVKAKYIKTVTPTKTWPNHQSYLTGLYAESHGIVSNKFWDPVYKEMFIFEYDCSNDDPKFYNASEPIWLTLQHEGGRSGSYFWPGATGYTENPTYYEKIYYNVNCSAVNPKDLPNMRNRTRSDYPPYIHCFPNYTGNPSRNRIDKIVGWLKSDEPPTFVALYIDDADWKGHEFGPDSDEYRLALKMVDRDVVGYLVESLKAAQLLDKVNLLFVSDHSFTAVSSDRQIYLDDYLDPSAYRLIESGAVGHIWPGSGKLEEIYENLTRAKNPHMTVYRKEGIPDSLHWKHNRRIPPIFVETKIGWQVQQARGSPGNWTRGEHGWSTVEAGSEHYSVFYARGPAFREGIEVPPFDTVDLYPLMSRLLGIKPRPNNGSFENVKAILLDSTTGKPTVVNAGQEVPLAFESQVVLLATLIVVSLINH